jgi:hypothetical protein
MRKMSYGDGLLTLPNSIRLMQELAMDKHSGLFNWNDSDEEIEIGNNL